MIDPPKLAKHVNDDLRTLSALANYHFHRLVGLRRKTDSQLRQDLFVLSETGFKRNGYFVDFGATNGKTTNNTYLLEKEFGWTGILAEPARVWHQDLIRNRNCLLSFQYVWAESGKQIEFAEVSEPELSTAVELLGSDRLHTHRNSNEKYTVESISLNDLLKKFNAPKQIDYLSIDTEGSEFEILSAFDFGRYDISIITCEHNFTPNRDKIYQLLTSKGYERRFEAISNWDDWYSKASN